VFCVRQWCSAFGSGLAARFHPNDFRTTTFATGLKLHSHPVTVSVRDSAGGIGSANRRVNVAN